MSKSKTSSPVKRSPTPATEVVGNIQLMLPFRRTLTEKGIKQALERFLDWVEEHPTETGEEQFCRTPTQVDLWQRLFQQVTATFVVRSMDRFEKATLLNTLILCIQAEAQDPKSKMDAEWAQAILQDNFLGEQASEYKPPSVERFSPVHAFMAPIVKRILGRTEEGKPPSDGEIAEATAILKKAGYEVKKAPSKKS